MFFKFFVCVSGHDKEVDSYVTKLERRTSALPAGLKVISNGISSVGTISAMDLPGVLIQVALAIGDHSSTNLPPPHHQEHPTCALLFFRASTRTNKEAE